MKTGPTQGLSVSGPARFPVASSYPADSCYTFLIMNSESPNPEEAWQRALKWFQKQEMGRRKVELTAIIRPLYESLKQAPDIEALHRLYVDPVDVEAALRSSQSAYPENKHLWDLSRTRDVAYGLRLAELRRDSSTSG